MAGMKNDLIIFGAKYLFIFVVLIAALTWLKVKGKARTQFLAGLIIAAVISVILVKIMGKLYYHPRPFVGAGVAPLVPHTPDNGFPSEHTTYTATISTVIYFYRRKFAAIAFGLALLVGISRVLAHVHSPIDILAGIAVGVAAGVAGYMVAGRFVKKTS